MYPTVRPKCNTGGFVPFLSCIVIKVIVKKQFTEPRVEK